MLHKYVCVFYGDKVHGVRQKYTSIVNVTSEVRENKRHKHTPTSKQNFLLAYLNPTLIPVLVASRTASISLSYLLSNAKVNAQSIIRPERKGSTL